MPRTGDYSLGKLYKSVADETDDIYIGSTYQKLLSMRLCGHKKGIIIVGLMEHRMYLVMKQLNMTIVKLH